MGVGWGSYVLSDKLTNVKAKEWVGFVLGLLDIHMETKNDLKIRKRRHRSL